MYSEKNVDFVKIFFNFYSILHNRHFPVLPSLPKQNTLISGIFPDVMVATSHANSTRSIWSVSGGKAARDIFSSAAGDGSEDHSAGYASSRKTEGQGDGAAGATDTEASGGRQI